MSLLTEVNNIIDSPSDLQSDGPLTPSGWSIGHLANHGIILSCDGFQLKLNIEELNKLFDIAEDGESGEIKDQNSHVVFVEPTSNSIILTRTNDEAYPNGVVLDLDTLKEIGIEQDEEDEEDEEDINPDDEDEDQEENDIIDVEEAIHTAYRRSGKKIKKGFRVTSGYRKGRVVANLKTAYKPKPKASTRMKLSIAGRRKTIIRVLKSKRTRKKSLSKRLARLNKNK